MAASSALKVGKNAILQTGGSDESTLRPPRVARFGRLLAWVVIAVFGAVEGLYGRTQYLGDWISYLNVSRAVSALDWRGIFNPMWNPGYPALVAGIRAVFPHSAEGEWYAIALLNWLILLLAFACWRYLIRNAAVLYLPEMADFVNKPLVLWTSTCVFLSCTLCLDRVSAVAPDLLVTTLFLLAAALTLRLLNRFSIGTAAALGLVLGIGCWSKGVFVSFAGIFLLTLVLSAYAKRVPGRALAVAGAIFLLVFAPLVAGDSWAYGRLTLGVSGPLNYAFHVNHVPHWTNWQGGPAEFGAPIHPTRHVLAGLPVFEFGTPFHTTYPPYNNMAYWYAGMRNVYSPRLQIIAIGRTLYFLAAIVKLNPFLWALGLMLILPALKSQWRRSSLATVKTLWPLWLPAALGMAAYLAVHVEDRYTSPFCLIFGLLPLFAVINPKFSSKRLLAGIMVVLYTTGAAAELKAVHTSTFRAAIHRADFHRDSQWELAAALPSYGIRGGDPVAIIRSDGLSYRCHWAYISHLRIIAEFGALPWTLAPWDRTRFDHVKAEPADQNYVQVFWKELTPEQRSMVVQAFRAAGAKAVISLTKPDSTSATGWVRIQETGAWIYSFGSNSATASPSKMVLRVPQS